MLKEFQNLVNRLQSTSGRIDKENILKEYIDNDSIKKIIEFIYNPYRLTGISKKKFHKGITVDPKLALDSLDDLLNYIVLHNHGRDEDISIIQHYVSHNYEYKDLIEAIVTKDLKLGVQVTTLNKIFGENFIPTFGVMLAEKYFDDPERYLPAGTSFTLTEKLDGVRCVCIVNDHIPEFFTRQGQPINGLVEISDEISKIVHDGVLDGELILENKNNLPSKDLYRATVKETNKDGEKHNLIYNIFDCIDIDEFMHGKSSLRYTVRRNVLNNFSSDIEKQKEYKIDHVKIVPTLYQGTDQTQIQYWLNKITAENGEGVMININDAYYECKRTRNLLKVKKMQTMDLRVVAVEQGTGINSGRLGAAVVEFPAPDGNVYQVKVGSGFTFEDRKYFWDNKDKIIDKIIEVQYFEVSQNEKGGYALRFPVFLHIREDKDEPSIY